MPRVRTSGPTPAVDFGLAALSLSPAGDVPSCSSAAEAAADGFAQGRTYRAYGHDARVFDLAFHPATSGLLISAAGERLAAARRASCSWLSAPLRDATQRRASHPSPPPSPTRADDCSVGLWRRQQGGTAAGGRYMQVAAFQGHADSVMRAAWSPDGHLVASGALQVAGGGLGIAEAAATGTAAAGRALYSASQPPALTCVLQAPPTAACACGSRQTRRCTRGTTWGTPAHGSWRR